MGFQSTFVTLFAVAAAVSLLSRRIKVPYTVALVVVGLVLGPLHRLPLPILTRDLLYSVFLPGLLFEAAFHLDFTQFWENRLIIHLLALPGVIATALLTAVLLAPLAHVSLHLGLLFGALIAATDPIAVVALFRRLRAPARLELLIEAESLLNDGTAAVLFTVVVATFDGAHVSAGTAALDFVRVAGLGVLMGAAVGLLVSKLIQQISDPMTEITLTALAAYGAFVAAEAIHASGVLATVVAGMLCGNYGARKGMSPTTRVALESFWEYVAFALNSVVFLLIGFRIPLARMLSSWRLILVAYLVVTLVRAVVVFGAAALTRRTVKRLPWSWSAIPAWGGLRGGLSMVLAMSLPPAFPERDLVETMTFGVIVLSIVLQGLTINPLLRLLKVVTPRTIDSQRPA